MPIDLPYTKRRGARNPETFDLESKQPLLKPSQVFPDVNKDGQVYRWGLAVATSGPIVPFHQTLSRVATKAKLRPIEEKLDWESLAQIACESYHQEKSLDVQEALEAILWASSINPLRKPSKRTSEGLIEHETALEFVAVLERLHEDGIGKALQPSSPLTLMLGGELGLVLAWQFPKLTMQSQLLRRSAQAVFDWCDRGPESVSATLETPTRARMVLASLIRSKLLLENVFCQRFPVTGIDTGKRLAHWIAAMTTPGGASAFSRATPQNVQDDLNEQGLLVQMVHFDSDSLRPAVLAALGATKTSERLTWQVHLPEPFLFCDQSKLAMMLPEWDVRRGRLHVDYSQDSIELEMFAGKKKMISGVMKTTLRVDQQAQRARGPWEEICHYSDDDVHYIELEQSWSGGLLLQRQFLVIRDDRCVLISDAVTAAPQHDCIKGEIHYETSLPLSDAVFAVGEEETREFFLHRRQTPRKPSGVGSARALVLPLSAPEWQLGPSNVSLYVGEQEEGQASRLVLSARGKDQLYAPLWIDCQRKRFKKKRTWRTLTVAESLRLCRPDEAAAFRIQVGGEHWAIYRSLSGRVCRSFLGKHMLTNFFASRFDPDDGSHDDLINVDDDEVT